MEASNPGWCYKSDLKNHQRFSNRTFWINRRVQEFCQIKNLNTRVVCDGNYTLAGYS
jgi:hypothetical protein